MEFALVAPLFLLLLFGIVEYSLINASIGAFNFAAKEGARYDAIVGNGSAPGTPAPPLDQYMVNSIVVPHVTGVVMAQMTQVEVYKATEAGGCFGSGTVPNCQYQDVLVNVGGTWQTSTNSWTTQRNDQLSNADYLGVAITYTYTYLTALFAVTSPSIQLSATSVQRIEPQQYGYHRQPAPMVAVESEPAPVSDALSRFTFDAIVPRREITHLAGERA